MRQGSKLLLFVAPANTTGLRPALFALEDLWIIPTFLAACSRAHLTSASLWQ
jgi:hypothetical protein